MKTNPRLLKLIRELKKLSREQKVKIWKRVADDLGKSTRRRREVNIRRINRATKEDETVVVPGKVLGTGEINHKVNVAAYEFSESAKDKLGGISIEELMEKNPKGSKVRIIG